ncbi:restriction endonuclease subunit S [Hyphomonas sp.]|uniref:restriction endonuclease subunit S n=1 Tax=Hyphomonas sp. TaxID=87 RepID=UPI00329A53CC
MIPEDWEVKTLAGVCRQIVDGTHFTPTYTQDGVPFYSVENVTANDFKNVKYISERDHEFQNRRCNPEKGDILMTRIGSLADTRLIDWDVRASIYVSLALLKVGDEIDPLYLYAYSRSHPFKQSVENRSLMSAVPKKINMGAIGDVPVPVPPTETEQAAIAEALSDVDEAIAAQEAVIAKKRALKTATMQALLSGTRRLPGFGAPTRSGRFKQTEVGAIPEDWDCTDLGRHALKVGSGKTPTGGNVRYKSSGRAFVRSQNVGWGSLVLDDLIFIDEATHAEFPATELEPGDVLLNITGASIGRSALADRRVAAGNVNQHVCIIRPKANELNPGFLCSFLLSAAGQSQIDSFQAGGNREGLNFKQVRAFAVPIPPTVSEQTAIAETLSDMDQEIAMTETKLVKLRHLKSGMMQQLLTGKIRLI